MKIQNLTISKIQPIADALYFFYSIITQIYTCAKKINTLFLISNYSKILSQLYIYLSIFHIFKYQVHTLHIIKIIIWIHSVVSRLLNARKYLRISLFFSLAIRVRITCFKFVKTM